MMILKKALFQEYQYFYNKKDVLHYSILIRVFRI